MITKEHIQQLVNDYLAEAEPDMFIVEVQLNSGNQIHVVLDSDNGLTIDKCIAVSRHIEDSLDRETEDFSLDVSSAGVGLPLVMGRQYVNNIGRRIEVLTNDSTKIKGRLMDAELDAETKVMQTIVVETEQKILREGSKRPKKEMVELRIAPDEMKWAKIVPEL